MRHVRVRLELLESAAQVVQDSGLVKVPKRGHISLERRIARQQLTALRHVHLHCSAVGGVDEEKRLIDLALHLSGDPDCFGVADPHFQLLRRRAAPLITGLRTPPAPLRCGHLAQQFGGHSTACRSGGLQNWRAAIG